MMDKKNLSFFRELVSTPSPSGFESPAQELVKNYLKPFADSIVQDRNGNLIAHKKGNGKLKVMVVGHADEIGMIVNYIDESGYLYVRTLGGFDVNLLPGLRLDIHHQGEVVKGVIGKKPVHMLRGGDDNPKLKLEDLWIDIGAANKEEALRRVAIGDIITFTSEIVMLSEDRIMTKATDNKAGVYVAAAVMEALAKKKHKADYYAVSSVGEETTMKGAITSTYQVEPDIAIAVDVSFTSDIPGADKRVYGDVSLGKGPVLTLGAMVHPKLNQLLIDLAAKHKIPLQIEIAGGRTGTDADAIHASRKGVATMVLSIPNRYMHSPNELISLSDLDNAVKLVTAFMQCLDEKVDLSR